MGFKRSSRLRHSPRKEREVARSGFSPWTPAELAARYYKAKSQQVVAGDDWIQVNWESKHLGMEILASRAQRMHVVYDHHRRKTFMSKLLAHVEAAEKEAMEEEEEEVDVAALALQGSALGLDKEAECAATERVSARASSRLLEEDVDGSVYVALSTE